MGTCFRRLGGGAEGPRGRQEVERGSTEGCGTRANLKFWLHRHLARRPWASDRPEPLFSFVK